jgi:predicted  nucleic acid-binding Zn-ribbon protein
MFRGGPVDSRGSGITANLGYNNGGRVGYKEKGFVDGGDIAANLNLFSPNFKTQDFYEKQIEANKYIPKYNTMEDFLKAYETDRDQKEETADMYMGTEFGTNTFEDQVRTDADYAASEEGKKKFLYEAKTKQDDEIRKANKYRDADNQIITKLDKDIKQKKELTADQERIALLEQQLKDIENDKTNEASTDIDTKEMIKMLGGDKARRRDVGDMLAGASAAFLGTGDVKEGFAEFMAQQAASGPSRLEKIEQAAATLDIKDKLSQKQSDRDLTKLLGLEKAKVGIRAAGANPKNLDWAGKKAYYADVLKTGSLKSNEVIRASIMATASEEGKDVITTTNTEIITSPDKFAVGLYVIDGGEKGKEVIEIKEDENGIKTAIPRDEFVI